MLTQKKTMRPQTNSTDLPGLVAFSHAFFEAVVSKAVFKLFELDLQMLGPKLHLACAQSVAPIFMHPFKVHRVNGVLLGLEPIARNFGNHDLSEAIAPRKRLPVRKQGR